MVLRENPRVSRGAPSRQGGFAALRARLRRRAILLVVAVLSLGAVVAFAMRGAVAASEPGRPVRGVARQGGADDLPRMVRDVYPFDVLGEDGEPYEHPFLGGLNIPRPQLLDIDDDDDLDLFVQEYSDAVMFFENEGTPREPRWVWRTDRFRDLGVGEWYHFVDMDDDGDLDALGEEPFSLIRYWRNTGSPDQARYELVTETLLDPDGEAIFSDRQNIPKAADIDCDGRMDLLLGRLEGTITRYEQSDTGENGAPIFRKVTDRFEGIEIIGQVLQQQVGPGRSPGPSLHGANTMAMEDIDDDGDLDLFWGDFFEPGLLFVRNTGSCPSPGLTAEPIPFPPNDPVRTSGYNAPGFGDVDGDGDADLLLGVLGGAFNPNRTTVDNFYFFEQQSPTRFDLRTSRFLTQIDVGSESYPAFADLDGDGDLDLVLGNKIEPDDPQSGRLYRFENVGSAAEPRFALRGTFGDWQGDYHLAPAFGDLDDDGDDDFLLASWDDQIALVENRGTAQEPEWITAVEVLVELTRGRNAVPTLGDVDGDGDLDLFVGESSGEVNFYRNVGSAAKPEFELVSDSYLEIDVGRRSAPTLVDLDGDGDLDLVIGSEGEGLFFYRNNGGPGGPAFEEDASLGLSAHPFSTPAFADIDDDGDPDFFAGGIAGGLVFYENGASGEQTHPEKDHE